MTNHTLLRTLITSSVVAINLFFKLKDAKVNRVLMRRQPSKSGTAFNARNGDARGPSQRSVSYPFAGTSISSGGGGDEGYRGPASSCPQETPTSFEYVEYSAQSCLPKLDRLFKFYYLFTHLAYWYLLLKNIFIGLMRSDTLAGWRYLDCFLPGRFIVNGRVIEVAHFCACYLILIRLIWRYTVARRTLELRMPFLEFMLGSQEQHGPYWSRELEASGVGDSNSERKFHSTLLEFYNPFVQTRGESHHRRHFKLRPNRTREAWNLLADRALRYYITFSGIFSIIVATFLKMGLPVVVTREGFAYSYRYCIQWIMSNRRQASGQSSSKMSNGTWTSRVYDLFVDEHQIASGEPLWRYMLVSSWDGPQLSSSKLSRPKIIQDMFMPFTDLVTPTLFHCVRTIIELFETIWIYFEVAMHFSAICFMSVMMSKDITLYCKSINERLMKLIASLRHVASTNNAAFNAKRSHYYDIIYSSKSNKSTYGRALERDMLRHEMKFVALRADTSEIQAMITDMFLTIDAYNKCISLQCLWAIVAWLGYSAMVSSWIFIPGNESPKLEWYVIHACGTCFMFLILLSMTSVKTSCSRLYNLITVAMALDDDLKTSKSVWVSLLKFYSPRPLYCFTMIGSIEVTNMLGIKLLIWLLSALIVASSFFHVYNIK